MDDIVFVVIENYKIIQMDHNMQFNINYATMMTVREFEKLLIIQIMNQNKELNDKNNNN